MGKHSAAGGASAHPIVARAEGEGGIGWPEPPPPEGGRTGWPGDARLVRRGWRRILAFRRAA